jgi:hypothetical protein
MWTTEVSRHTKASKESIWQRWADVAHWNHWDKEVESSELFGDFRKGTKGMLKPVGGPKTGFEILACEKYHTFIDRSFLPLCRMDFIHTLTETKDGLLVTHKVTMSGLMTFLFSKVIGKNVEAGLPTAVEKLIELAEMNYEL